MRRMIASFFSIVIAFTFAITLASPAAAGDQHYRSRDNADKALMGVVVGAFAGAILGGIIASQPRHHNRVPYYDNNDRRGQQNSRRLNGNGERAGAGQYCPHRLTYNQYNGRYYCTR